MLVDGVVELAGAGARAEGAAGYQVRALAGGWDVTAPDGSRLLAGPRPGVPAGSARYDAVLLDLALEEDEGIQAKCPNGSAYVWTRKQAGVRAHGQLILGARPPIAIDALADGIARQKLADPHAVPDDLMGRIIGLLLAGATRPRGDRGTHSAP